MEVRTLFVQGKLDDDQRCEDVVVARDRCVAVIDGISTAGHVTLPDGTVTSSGRAAALAVAAELGRLADHGPLPTPRETIDLLTAAVADLPAAPDGRRAGVAVTLLDPATRRVVRVGDGPVRIGDRVFGQSSRIDQVTVGARCALLHALLAEGADPDQIHAHDPGRELILPLLDHQHLLSNRPGPYGYAAVNGTPVPDEYLEVFELPEQPTRVVLASDGYPDISGTWLQAEAELARRLHEDPLRIGALAGTRTLDPAQLSYDDRAWLELLV